MQGGVRLNNKVMVTQSLRRVIDQKFRKLKKLSNSSSWYICSLSCVQVSLVLHSFETWYTRWKRARSSWPARWQKFPKAISRMQIFSTVETLPIIFPMVELPYGHIFIVIREKNYTSPYRASILSRNVSYSQDFTRNGSQVVMELRDETYAILLEFWRWFRNCK